jgi:uncharacterized protein (DUF2267 family)
MATSDVTSIDRSVEKTNAWLRELAVELGRPDDRRYAYRVLRAFLHTLRDRLPVNSAVHLAAQLPELLRGVYYEGWRPNQTPQAYHDLDTFIARIAAGALLSGHTESVDCAEAAAVVLRRHITAGELEKIAAALPTTIADLLVDMGGWS